MSLLSAEEQRDFREWEKGFETPFWQKIVRDLQEEIDNAPAHFFWNAKDWDAILAARARLAAMAQLVNYPTIIENKKENLLQSRQFALDEETETGSVEHL